MTSTYHPPEPLDHEKLVDEVRGRACTVPVVQGEGDIDVDADVSSSKVKHRYRYLRPHERIFNLPAGSPPFGFFPVVCFLMMSGLKEV